MFKFYLLFIAVITSQLGLCQNKCVCNNINDEKMAKLIASNDSNLIFKTIFDLNATNNIACKLNANFLEVKYYFANRNFTKAKSSIDAFENLLNNSNCKNIFSVYVYLSYTEYYKQKLDFENAARYNFKALEAAKIKDNKVDELEALKNVILINTRQKQKEKNTLYYNRAKEIVLTLPENYNTAANYNWLSMQYETLGNSPEKGLLRDSSLMFCKKALRLAQKSNNYKEVMQAYRMMESYAVFHDDFKTAIKYIDSAIYYSKKLKIIVNPSGLYLTKALDYSDLKNYKQAQVWLDSSIYYAEKFEGKGPTTITVYQQAANMYEDAGDVAKALAMHKAIAKMKDSVFKQNSLERINELEQKYNKAQNEKTIKELAQQKQIYLLLSLAGLLSAIAIAFYLRQKTLKHKKDILETEQRLNRARMNPHFFFNALTALQKFALQENNGQEMASNLSKFSNIMRETLESTYKEYVTIEQEIDFLNEYLEVQKIRFPKTFSYEVSAHSDVEIDAAQIPAMIIQPFIENSIEHGFAGVDYPGKISVTFSKTETELLIEIKDNGKGLATYSNINKEHISRASQIIKDRIYLLNIKLKTKAGFGIDNLPEGGVIVKIHLPILYKD